MALEEFVGKLQKGLCCGVCTELLYQPFNLNCGHVFCYSVISPLAEKG
jgi:zinc finger of C3HC4-type, RING